MKPHLGLIFGIFAFSAIVSMAAPLAPSFREKFRTSLGEYWCENHLSVADLDGDGHKDIVLMTTALTTSEPPWGYKAQVRLLRGDGSGVFTSSIITNFPGRYGYGAVTADLNRDGAIDLILREQATTHILLNKGKGDFYETWTGRPGYYGATTFDANGDGYPDVVSGTQTGHGGLIELFLNDGFGTQFTKSWESSIYGFGWDSIETVLVLNLNGDAYPDLASREIYGGLLITHLGEADTATPFLESNVTRLGDRTFALAGGRLNEDDLDDVAAYVGWGHVRVFLNQGDGNLYSSWESPSLGEAAFNLAVADFDGDGANDIFVGTFSDGKLRIYRNVGETQFAPWYESSLQDTGYTGSVTDVNEDGLPDLIVGGHNDIRVLLNDTARPVIESIRPSSKGMGVTWRALPGKQYQIQYKDQIESGDWKDLGRPFSAITEEATVNDGGAVSTNRRFYRVMQIRD